MTNLAARVRRYVVRQRLWPRGSRVAAAVSGGGDSVALLQLLGELAASGDLVLAGVVHLNHQLRATADRDEALCRRLAADAGVPFDAARVDVAAAARAARCSVEVAARDARYAFFEQARTRLGADVVAVAHTRDDQAETVLIRLLRGTGTRGLRGALPRRGVVVRPLLGLWSGRAPRLPPGPGGHLGGGRDQHRPGHPQEPGSPRPAAAACPRLPPVGGPDPGPYRRPGARRRRLPRRRGRHRRGRNRRQKRSGGC